MPEINDLELLVEIKERFLGLPVMMVTAYGDDDRRRHANDLGAAQSIAKPVDLDLLKPRLRKLPNAAALRQPPHPSGDCRRGLARSAHSASPTAIRRPERKSSRCSGRR